MSAAKPFVIEKRLVYEAFLAVKANKGAAGVDGETIEEFEKGLEDNLYKIWNRMSSGSYFPDPVRAVSIPKKSGGERVLGVPTVRDRVAQTVVTQVLEPILEPVFLENSYGYRPGRSALDAIGVTRKRCWQYNWVLDFDIKGLFDNIDHELLLKALRKHTECKWVLLYVERWLTAPMIDEKGSKLARTQGTPQGAPVSPLLANLFLHYVFDLWMTRTYPNAPWCRYADDGLVHCRTEQEAQGIKEALQARLVECRLGLHPEKTRIVYCKDSNRRGKYKTTKFDFLGYTFRPRSVKNTQRNVLFISFAPAVSSTALLEMKRQTRKSNIRNRTDLSLEEIAEFFNPVLRGWLEYYGRYNPSALRPVLRHVNKTLIAWAMRKFRRLRGTRGRAGRFIEAISKRQPNLFAHWQRKMAGSFA